jgi:LmbE family N-acetylglucosaminyl deacetylase
MSLALATRPNLLGAGADLVRALENRQPTATRVALIVAHPDDETIGAGGSLRLLSHLTIVLATDGTPENLAYARRNGFTTNAAYNAARKAELRAAFAVAGLAPPIVELGLCDQGLSYRMAELVRMIVGVVANSDFDAIITQAYEGGHPDHDAVAFAVRFAQSLRARHNQPFPDVLEMTSYHAGPGGTFVPQRFLPNGPPPAIATLSVEDQACKQAMFACFVTQQRALKIFRAETEAFRRAPDYDFSQPAHAGVLHYERRDWGMTGARWRAMALSAADSFG